MNKISKFVIIDHEAKRARYHQDLRFIKPNGKLWDSFAVRKGVPLDPGVKVLAVKTRDHSEKDALFVGVLKKGYGAGEFTKFDDGECIIEKYKNSHMVILLKGKKIKGRYHLISTGVIDKDYKKPTYMLFKSKI